MMNKLFIIIPVLVLLSGSIAYSSGESIPAWVKNTALWYGEEKISDQEYLDSIKFLIENEILTIDTIKQKPVIEPIVLTPEESFIDPRITMCNVLYNAYVVQDKSKFQEEYFFISYLQDCMDLYEDKVWKYQGDDRTERIYNKFVEIHTHNTEFPETKTIESHVQVRSLVNAGHDKYMIQFDICAGDKQLDKAKVLVKSNIEVVVVGSDKDIYSNSCRNYSTQIHAKHTENIEIEIIEKVIKESDDAQ
jgi:hypothetical protein